MRNIYSLPCDSDTFGAIAGGVAEEFYHGFGDIDAEGILKKHLTDALFETLTDDGEKLEWVSLDELSNNDIRPVFLKMKLKGVIEGGPLIHIINDERNK